MQPKASSVWWHQGQRNPELSDAGVEQVTITAPHHPLIGQSFPVIGRRTRHGEPHVADPAAARRENSARVREAIHPEAGPAQSGEPATPIPVGGDRSSTGVAPGPNLRY